ncbi:hypothetical protein [Mycobacterium sp. SMC-4]|uniref:hypothetical protein n=1 Tax=Mycobacterium sp. SMC-4 TaxID=2857059 RepID=UPI0021B45D9C|nr:hypothetical protein [Mycobacterium sp. SMC-4]UXA19286.1 hypothetical protein KXD98_06590 [Mycobacterium sp. SMC-4]
MASVTPQRVKSGLRRAWSTLEELRLLSATNSWTLLTDRSDNPLTASPRRYWSQADEDGILEQILKRIDSPSNGVFVEFGVGDGSQCNTLILLSLGWSGAWISGEELIFEPRPGGRLAFERAWIFRETIVALAKTALARVERSSEISLADVDVVSLDLDGNDFHFTEELLNAGLRPRVWISEYNARFPVGSRWVMDYNDEHTWTEGDYFGASLSAFAALFESFGYFPVACSAQGANAFFVRDDYAENFSDVPKDLSALYRPLLRATRKWGHEVSAKTLESMT